MKTNENQDSYYGVPIPEWYQGYVHALNGGDAVDVMRKNLISTPEFFESINSDLHDYAYQPGKWTVKEILLHIIDAERVFAYRALCFARNETNELPGFDENSYVPNSGANTRTMASLIEEYKSVRLSSLTLFENLTDEMWKRIGKANGYRFSVRLSALIIAGHELHHLKIINERYLNSSKP